MKHYTTITFDNSLIHYGNSHQLELAMRLKEACEGFYYRNGTNSFTIGQLENRLATVQQPKSSEENTVYVFVDGFLQELNPNSTSTRDLQGFAPEKYKELLAFLNSSVNELNGDSTEEILTEELINSGETNEIVPIDDEVIVSKWLKKNKIDITIAKLKKYKPTK